MERSQEAEIIVIRNQKFLDVKEKSISADGSCFLIFARCRLEEMEMKKDSGLYEMLKEVSCFWYGKLTIDLEGSMDHSAEFQMMKMEMDDSYDEVHIYDILLYMVNKLNQLRISLQKVKERYPYLARAMGEYLDEMLNCTSQTSGLKYKKCCGKA